MYQVYVLFMSFYLILQGDAGCEDWFLDSFFYNIFMCKFAH